MTKQNITTKTSRQAQNKTNHENILAELRGHYGNLSEILMELIDNSSSAFERYSFNGHIDVTLTKVGENLLRVVVRDNGSGIEDIDVALSIGNKSGAQSASNDHAQGFKNLPVKKIYLRTANLNGEYYYVEGPFYEGVEIQECEPFADLPQGTEFVLEVDYEYLRRSTNRWGEKTGSGNCTKFFTLIECVVEDIAVVHGLRMQELGYTISVTANDGFTEEEYEVQPLFSEIEPFDAMDPDLGSNEKTEGEREVEAFDGEGTITMKYCFGEAKPNRESRKRYFAKKLSTQGAYYYHNGRYIGKTESLGIRAPHPSNNGCMATINLLMERASQGPQTEIAKTGYIENSLQYAKLRDLEYSLVPNIDHILHRESSKKLTELAITKEFSKRLVAQAHRVEHQPLMPGETKAKADVIDFTTKTIYEMKTKSAADKDVWQLFGYISTYLDEQEGRVPFDKAYLCALDLPTEAAAAIKHANFMLAHVCDIRIEYRNLYEVAGDVISDLSK